MAFHYALFFLLAFLGTVAGHAVCHHGTRALQIRQAVQQSHVETQLDHALCGYCRSLVARYELFKDGTAICANCVREKQPSK